MYIALGRGVETFGFTAAIHYGRDTLMRSTLFCPAAIAFLTLISTQNQQPARQQLTRVRSENYAGELVRCIGQGRICAGQASIEARNSFDTSLHGDVQ